MSLDGLLWRARRDAPGPLCGSYSAETDNMTRTPAPPEDALRASSQALENRLIGFRAEKLSLDLTRGKPSSEQLDLLDLLDGILEGDFRCEDGSDARNYGALDGIPEMKRLGAEYLGVDPTEVLADGNSSLQVMYQYVLWAMHYGPDGRHAWNAVTPVKFLCPVPGYDRHFALCEEIGIEMIPVPMTGEGPDMDIVETLVRADPAIRGM